jgi:hypothetical protein
MLSCSFQKGGLDSTRICDGKTLQWVLVVTAAFYIPVAHCWSERCRNRVFHLLHHTGEQWRAVREPMSYGRVVFGMCHVHATATTMFSRHSFFSEPWPRVPCWFRTMLQQIWWHNSWAAEPGAVVGYHVLLPCGIVTTPCIVEWGHLSMQEHVFIWQAVRACSYGHQQRYAEYWW